MWEYFCSFNSHPGQFTETRCDYFLFTPSCFWFHLGLYTLNKTERMQAELQPLPPWRFCCLPDCGLREPADGGRVHPAALSGHPGEHGAQQPQPLPSSGPGNHRGTAHRAPASVSTHTRTGASCTLNWGGTLWDYFSNSRKYFDVLFWS